MCLELLRPCTPQKPAGPCYGAAFINFMPYYDPSCSKRVFVIYLWGANGVKMNCNQPRYHVIKHCWLLECFCGCSWGARNGGLMVYCIWGPRFQPTRYLIVITFPIHVPRECLCLGDDHEHAYYKPRCVLGLKGQQQAAKTKTEISTCTFLCACACTGSVGDSY